MKANLRTTSFSVMYEIFLSSEAVVQRCSVKNVFLKMLKNYEENTCATASI